jgi:hypothetical protein
MKALMVPSNFDYVVEECAKYLSFLRLVVTDYRRELESNVFIGRQA